MKCLANRLCSSDHFGLKWAIHCFFFFFTMVTRKCSDHRPPAVNTINLKVSYSHLIFILSASRLDESIGQAFLAQGLPRFRAFPGYKACPSPGLARAGIDFLACINRKEIQCFVFKNTYSIVLQAYFDELPSFFAQHASYQVSTKT